MPYGPYGCGYPGLGWGCGCNPEVPACSPMLPQQGDIQSQVANLAEALFGSFTVTVVNGRAVWTQLCSANSSIPGFPPNTGEGMICYLLRVMTTLFTAVQITPYATSITAAEAIPTLNRLAAGSIVGIMNAIALGQLSFYQFAISPTRPAANGSSIFYPNDNSQGFFTLVT